jgi:hypothetical protein
MPVLWDFLKDGADGHVINLSQKLRTLDAALAAAQN